MLAEYKKKTYIGIGIAFAVWVLGGILIGYLGESLTEDDARPILTLGIIPFVYGIWAYAKGKGYHGGWGLLGGFFPFFLIILFFFPDKHKTVKKQNQEVKEPIQKVNKQNLEVKEPIQKGNSSVVNKIAGLSIIVSLVLAGMFYIVFVEIPSWKSQDFEELAKGLIEQYREKYRRDLPIVFKRFGGFRQESKGKYIAIVEVDYEKKMFADNAGKFGIEVAHEDLLFYIEIQDYGKRNYAKFSVETMAVLEEIRKETRSFELLKYKKWAQQLNNNSIK